MGTPGTLVPTGKQPQAIFVQPAYCVQGTGCSLKCICSLHINSCSRTRILMIRTRDRGSK